MDDPERCHVIFLFELAAKGCQLLLNLPVAGHPKVTVSSHRFGAVIALNLRYASVTIKCLVHIFKIPKLFSTQISNSVICKIYSIELAEITIKFNSRFDDYGARASGFC